jgi:transcriptional regulator with XRE-family HTH domain
VNRHARPPFLSRRLGRRLKALREKAGLGLDEAALKLEKARSSLHRIETGQTRADIHIVRSMMDTYDCYEDDLLDKVREAAKPKWFRAYGTRAMGYVDAETEASAVHEFAGLNLPGLLQTEPYILALFARDQLRRTAQELENDVTVRLIRQRRLTSEEDPLELVAIIDEAALRRVVGGPEVMRAQLHFLIERAALPTVTLQVLPLSDGSHSSMDSGFILLSFPEPTDPALLYVSYVTGALHIEQEPELRAAKLTFERLRTEARSPADSVTLIEQLADELYGP